MEEEVKKVIEWIKEYVAKSGAKGIVIGNSGGKDSATVIALCTKALGKERVLTIAIPCNSQKKDLEDAKLVAETFNVQMINIDLTENYNNLVKNIESTINDKLITESTINMRPRLRMTILYAIAQQNGYLVAGTSNLCEITVGYTTKWGDSASDFNPIAEFTVDEVIEMGKILGVPKQVIEKAPNDGLGSGTDEQKLGVTYKQIAEYINTSRTETNAMKKIEELKRKTEHKRNKIPVYKRNRGD